MRVLVFCTALVFPIVAVVGGCRTADGILGVDRHADIPPGAVPAQLGTQACQWQQMQTSRAEQDYFVLYRNEWRDGANEDGTRLGPSGERRLEEFAHRLPHEPFSVVIEKSEDAVLDESRLSAVVTYLQQQGLADAGSRVVIGRGEALGLYGVEAPRIGAGFLGTSGTGGGSASVNAGGGGSSSGSGSGGGSF